MHERTPRLRPVVPLGATVMNCIIDVGLIASSSEQLIDDLRRGGDPGHTASEPRRSTCLSSPSPKFLPQLSPQHLRYRVATVPQGVVNVALSMVVPSTI